MLGKVTQQILADSPEGQEVQGGGRAGRPGVRRREARPESLDLAPAMAGMVCCRHPVAPVPLFFPFEFSRRVGHVNLRDARCSTTQVHTGLSLP